jgi:hypothetical protein
MVQIFSYNYSEARYPETHEQLKKKICKKYVTWCGGSEFL